MPLMSENAGAKLSGTRRIWQRVKKKRDEAFARLEVLKQRPGYNPETCLTTDCVRMGDRWLSCESVPVGVLPELWRKVCDEHR